MYYWMLGLVQTKSCFVGKGTTMDHEMSSGLNGFRVLTNDRALYVRFACCGMYE